MQRMLGNAVPSLVAEVLAREIRRQLLDTPLAGPLHLLPPRREFVPPPRTLRRFPTSIASNMGAHDAKGVEVGVEPAKGRAIPFSTFVCESSASAIAAVSSKVKMETRSWRMRSTVGFGGNAQSSHSIGSQLITCALTRFMRPASGSECVAHFLVILARHPDEATGRRVPRDTRSGGDCVRSARADASPPADSRRAHPSPCSVCSSADRDCRSR